jgi:hypothetical protein
VYYALTTHCQYWNESVGAYLDEEMCRNVPRLETPCSSSITEADKKTIVHIDYVGKLVIDLNPTWACGMI